MPAQTNHKVLAKGLVERIGLKEGIFTHKPDGKPQVRIVTDIPDHTAGIDLIVKAITDREHGVLESLDELGAVGHRVAHGGEYYKGSILIGDTDIDRIETYYEMAPLHIPANLKGIQAVRNLLPGIPQTANFDTAFHQTMPAKSYIYGLPYEYYTKYGVRRYGFHGTSHRYVAEKGCAMTGIPLDRSRIITCHIGNGASITAILNGRSIDTSMGFTPVDGLIMGTRSGDVDPGAVTLVTKKEGMTMDEAWEMLNRRSGLLGISGVSSDLRDVHKAAEEGNNRARLGLEAYYYRIKKYIGAYAAALGGLDLLVFTGGVGENDPEMRLSVCSDMEFLGLRFDAAANAGLRGEDKIISQAASRVKAVVATTDEELVIARETFILAGGDR